MPFIRINLGKQTLELLNDGKVLASYSISSSKFGAGEENGSHKTPRGTHYIRAKIGTGAPLGAVFRGRRPTGETWSPGLAKDNPDRDWILSRILWLCGCEPGKNRLGNVDSMRRYIYIHGTPDTEPMGTPASIGCIRMRNDDVVDLYNKVEAGCKVEIEE